MYKLKKDNTKIEVELVIDNKEWEEGVEKVYQQSKGKFSVEGFRKGHAPRKVIEKTYGDSVFFDDTFNYFYEKTMTEILQKNPDYEPVTQPRSELQSFTVEDGLKVKITFEIVPDFKMCKYTGVNIKVAKAEVKEEDLQHQIHHLLEDNAKFEVVDRPVKNGDSVLIDFMGFLNDVQFAGGTATDYTLEIGSHSFVDNFEDQLVGAKKGETVDVNVTFPKDYPSEELKGQKVVFKVTIKEVREKHLPNFDDKFVADTTEFETVDAYRKDLTAHIQTMKEQEQKNEFEFKLRQYLVENTEIQIPEAMIDTYTQSEIERMRETLQMYGMTLEDYITRTEGSFDEEKYRKSMREKTIESIKIRYIYRKIYDENKLQVTASELKKETKGITDEHRIAHIENNLMLNKIHEFLRNNNTMEVE